MTHGLPIGKGGREMINNLAMITLPVSYKTEILIQLQVDSRILLLLTLLYKYNILLSV